MDFYSRWIDACVVTFLAFAFSGCATKPTEILVSCVPASVPSAPPYADDGDAIQRAADAGERYQIVATANEERKKRQAVTEPVIEGCR